MESILTFGHAGHPLSGHQPQLSMHQWTTLDLTAVAQYSEQHKTKQDIGPPGASAVVLWPLHRYPVSVFAHAKCGCHYSWGKAAFNGSGPIRTASSSVPGWCIIKFSSSVTMWPLQHLFISKAVRKLVELNRDIAETLSGGWKYGRLGQSSCCASHISR